MTLVLRYAARSDRGLVRSSNQDSVYAGPRLLALADGMGGHAAGEVASKVVIASLAPLDDDEPGDDLLSQLREAVGGGNAAISELVANDPDLDGMGTTLTAMLFSGSRMGMVHVGDSRAYLFRNSQFAQITRDDSFVNELLEQGRITADQAATHPQRSLLLKALTGHEVEPSLTVREARAGDRYLLCSDGLSGMVSDETLAEAIQIPDPQDCADRMIELALKGGGTDNVTVIVADVVDVDFGDDAPIVGGAAGDGSDEYHQGDSPAARARALTAPPPPPPQLTEPFEENPKAKRRKRWRWFVGIVLVLVLLAAGGIATRYFVLSQYYVGEGTNNEVAIFRGVPGSILGIQLHQQAEGSCPPGGSMCDVLTVPQLQQDAQSAVRNGVKKDTLQAARDYINNFLRYKTLKDCSTQPTSPADPQQQSTSSSPTTSASGQTGADCQTTSFPPGGGG
ncbi:protein phosphatase 2C domain-containing protein [Amycolatopsis acidiphila]|uniref:Serine/threonine protein phosphatase PstP n=1 Tax=Amycolatopsis acidiphila TaxID=715473 RepID=A0A558AFV8_9PSEU|nr:PP2C family serine/threonine-protein phosphatase [Amycolatopsis acidiphila]TVT23151.1 serine/threonine-protein phosphatase [Amycolatopsis acidiphila]UIJ60159.1 protein phosphatase 2C domain-containing protein [Amycolatopsis acidiphila]GHG61010.1 protein phosphatase [Amycolatopsis acidiphila]